MAKLYVLTEENIKSGKMPKQLRNRHRIWKVACLILSGLVILEHAALFYWMH